MTGLDRINIISTSQDQCTYSVLICTPHGTNLAGEANVQTRQGQGRERNGNVNILYYHCYVILLEPVLG